SPHLRISESPHLRISESPHLRISPAFLSNYTNATGFDISYSCFSSLFIPTEPELLLRTSYSQLSVPS
ncbi:hypothetical protein, partial [Dapis sp. BLCC M229]|uniref:hypothetical protein n=1 Tax=Dapis sp. BLCC M229 TaxID=3400188 RepID=UPI003CED108D